MPVYGGYQEDTVGMKRHVGKIKSTDRRCVVAFMQIPGLEDHALIIDTDALPDRYHDALFGLLNSTDAQKEACLANILGRRLMPDTGEDMFLTLHRQGYLQRMHVDNIIMCPRPSLNLPLRQVLEAMGKKIPVAAQHSQAIDPQILKELYEQPESNETHRQAQPDKFSHFDNNRNAEGEERMIAVARNLLLQARDLEDEAAKKKNEAYRMAPSLAPRAVQTYQPIVETYDDHTNVTEEEPKKKAGRPKKSEA